MIWLWKVVLEWIGTPIVVSIGFVAKWRSRFKIIILISSIRLDGYLIIGIR